MPDDGLTATLNNVVPTPETRPVTVGISQEVLDIDFGLQLVRTSRISGHVDNPDGTRPSGGNVNLTPEGAAGGRGNLGTNFGSRIDWDGSFAINNVPPGRYTLRARSNDSEVPLSASQPLAVAGGDLANVSVMLATGGTVSGTILFEPTQAPAWHVSVWVQALLSLQATPVSGL